MRDGGEEKGAVRFADNPAVEDDDDSCVSFCAYEAAETLLEFDYGCGELIIVKRIAAVFFDLLDAACDKGAIGNGEGQADDNHV